MLDSVVTNVDIALANDPVLLRAFLRRIELAYLSDGCYTEENELPVGRDIPDTKRQPVSEGVIFWRLYLSD